MSALDLYELKHDKEISSLIFLNTRDGNYTTTYEDAWDIALPRLNNLRGFRLSLESIGFANAVYPINSNNNKVYFTEDGGATLTATLTSSSYSGTQMATHLATQLGAAAGASGTYTGTYSSQTKKITITVASGITNFGFTTGVNDAYDELGFYRASLAAEASSQTSDAPVSLGGTEYVDVVMNFSGHNYSSSTTSNVLARIFLDGTFGTYIRWDTQSDDKFFVSANQIDEIRFQLRDDKANVWLLPTNFNVAMTLKIQPTF